jgi:hypothetical protein
MKGFKKFLSVTLVAALMVAGSAMSFADSAPNWLMNKDYEEGDYVKFRGSIYIVTEDHESSADKYPGNGDYWSFYKKGAGFKKGELPSEGGYNHPADKDRDKDEDRDRDKDRDRDDTNWADESIYEEDQVKVFYEIEDADEDGYTAKITIENEKEIDLEDWTLIFDFDDDEEIADFDSDVDVDQTGDDVVITPDSDLMEIESKSDISFDIEIEADYTIESDDDDNDEDEDNDDAFEDQIERPSDFDLELVFESVETGAILIQMEEPDFDDDLFTPEVSVGDEEQEIEWGESALFTDLIADEDYEIEADSYEEDGVLYRAVIEDDDVSVDAEELKIIEIYYEEVEQTEETGNVLVYVFKPSFDEDLFTPEITIDGVEKDVDWGEYVYFKNLEAGESFEVEAEDYEIDGETFEPELSVDEVEVDEDKVSYVLIKYVRD